MSGNPIIFDRPLLRARRRRARALGPETFLIDRVAADLAERLSAVLRQFDIAVDLGTPTDAARTAFTDVREMGTLLQRAGLALPVTDVDRLTVRYSSAFTLMAELRRMGATNALTERRRTPLRRATLLRMAEIYAKRFADRDGRIRAT